MKARAVIAVALGVLAFAAPRALAVEPEPEFCKRALVHDFLRPLHRLDALRAPPADQRLPFAPKAIRLLSGDSLQTGSGTIGFALYHDPLPRPLNWHVSSTVTRIRANGEPVGRERVRRRTLVRPHEGLLDLSFPVSAKPALYRIEIVFENKSGKRLGRYGRYFRVVPVVRRARLGVESSQYHAGEIVYARVENYGTTLVTFGVPYAVERYDGSTWVRAPESPKGPWIMPLLSAQSGYTGRCFGFRSPASMPPGLYRMVKGVGYPPVKPQGHESHATLTAEFKVVP